MTPSQHLLLLVLILNQVMGLDASHAGQDGLALGLRGSVLLPTEGLIHWWPDPWTVKDAITGRQGVRRGFGPIPEDPTNRFGYTAGWVELGPGITNRTFTVACWLWASIPGSLYGKGTIFSQDSGLNNHWCLALHGGEQVAFQIAGPVSHDRGPVWSMSYGWHHVVVSVALPSATVWVDGQIIKTGQIMVPDDAVPGPLCVGNNAIGNEPWNGDLRDLRIYDRPLEPDERPGRLCRKMNRQRWPVWTSPTVSSR